VGQCGHELYLEMTMYYISMGTVVILTQQDLHNTLTWGETHVVGPTPCKCIA